MASLNKKWLCLYNYSKFLLLCPPLRLIRTYGLYRLEIGNKIPNSPQDLASKEAPGPPKIAKISQNWLKIH